MMKKIVVLVLLVIVLSFAFAAETLAKKGKKGGRKSAGRFVERCRAVRRGGKVVYSERCGAAVRRTRKSSGKRFVEKCRKVTKAGKVIYSESCKRRTRKTKKNKRVAKKKRTIVKCWRFRSGKKGKRVARKCRRCRKGGKRRNSKKLRRRLAAWRRKHRGLKKIWYYLAQLEKKLVSQRSSLETVSKKKHTKYLSLVKKVEVLKKQFETAKAEYEKLKKAVDAKESGFEQLVEKLKTFEVSFNKIRAIYIKHVRIAERLYAKYQKTLSSKRYLRLQAELRVLAICKTKMRWLSHLIKKYVRVKTVHHKEYVFLYRKRKVLVDGKCVCPVVLRPVCGKDGVTYSSRCVARCAGAKFDYRGVCKCTPSKPVPPKTVAPKTTKPKTTKPKTNKPKTNKPKTNKPKTTKPKTTKPKTTKPKTTKPKTNKPTTKPATQKPKTTRPRTQKPKTQKPKEKIEEVKCSRVNKGGKIVESCA